MLTLEPNNIVFNAMNQDSIRLNRFFKLRSNIMSLYLAWDITRARSWFYNPHQCLWLAALFYLTNV